IRVLSPATILARLKRSLALLRSSAPDRPSRHRTLRAAIEWSYDLLSPAEQVVFRRLGVFVGECTLDAAEGVVAAAELGLDALDALASLVDKSLVHAAAPDEDAPRFHLVDTTREYALDRLAASGDLEATARRHAAHFVALAERAALQLAGHQQSTWFACLERE